MKRFFPLVLVVFTVLALGGCSWFGNHEDSPEDTLIKDGFSYNDDYGWYEKETEVADTYTVTYNLSTMDPNLHLNYEISDGYNKVIFIGKSTVTYKDLSILVAGRYSDLTIELRNFKFEGRDGTAAIDATDVNANFQVTIEITGTSSVKGGIGSAGINGISYGADRFDSSTNNPREGGIGAEGSIGAPGIVGNNIGIKVNPSATFTVIGGNGGSGGNGGTGEGGSMSGIGQSGHGGRGAKGGSGGYGISVANKITILNEGALYVIGGNGGDGGNGGNGGNNLDTAPTDRADHGGNGADGGNGGNGGIAFYVDDSAAVSIGGNKPSLSGGNGGTGGNGGNGGNSCKCMFQTSDGGNPGAAGNGGNGGNGGRATEESSSPFVCKGGSAGTGGKAGVPGYNPEIGYGTYGTDGSAGQGTLS